MTKLMKAQRGNVKDILIIFLFSFLIFSACFPEYHIFPSVCLFLVNFNQGYTSAAIVTNQFYHGGIQLWARYDQMPDAYYAITQGLYRIFEVLTTIVYACVSPFIWDQAKAFHHVYSIVFVVTNLFLKVTGSYLLLKRFTSNKMILGPAVIFLSVFLSGQLVKEGVALPSFYPLAIHFALNIFERRTLKDLFIFITFMTVYASYSILHALYLYCNLHFLLLSACAWSIWENRRNWKGTWGNIRLEAAAQWPLFALMLLCCVFIFAPYAYMITHCLKDFYFNEQVSRIHHMWSPQAYLLKVVPQTEAMTNFIWASSCFIEGHYWTFSGCAVVFLGLAGVLFSTDNRKYIFFGTMAFLLMLGSPHPGVLADSLKTNIFAWSAHWITIWTNPVKFILRDFREYMTYALPYLIMPLAVMGVEALYSQYSKGLPLRKSFFLLAGIYLYGGICLWHMKQENFMYVLSMLVLMTVLTACSMRQADRRLTRIKVIILIAFFVIDSTCSYIYLRRCFFKIERVCAKAQTILGETTLGPVGLKYNNPQILPFRQYFSNHFYNAGEDYYLTVGYLNYSGALFNFTNISKNFVEWDPHQYPRPKAFSSLPEDSASFRLLFPDGPLIYGIRYAIDDSPENFSFLSKYGIEKDVALIRNDGGAVLDQALPVTIQPRQGPEYKFNSFSGQLNTAKHYESDGLALYAIPLPAPCPSDESSTFLTGDKYLLRFSAELTPGKFDEFSPVQGQIVTERTFDVNNIRKGWVVAGLAQNQQAGRYRFSCGQRMVGVTDIWKNQEDNFGFDYNALNNGWVMMLNPYDPKWKIFMDGRPIKFYLANHAFISFPITQGKHKILMRYWPQTPLRGLLLISIILSTICFIGLIYEAMTDSFDDRTIHE